MKKSKQRSFVLILYLAFIFVGCAQPTPTATPAALPNPTPTPVVPLVILLAPPESDGGLASLAAELASAYASGAGMQFEQRSLLNPAELPASLAKLIVLAPDPGAAALAAAAPQAQVIAIGLSPEGGPSNLVSITPGANDGAKTAFIAGYVAAMTAEDWRTGILFTGASAASVNDFVAGVEYFCGSCVPSSPPFGEYTVAAQAVDAQNWQPAADQLLAQFVKVIYLTPELEASGAAQYLANAGVLLIGQGIPPVELAGSWLVSVTSDPTEELRKLLPLALDGQPLPAANSLSLANSNPSLLSEPRLLNVQRIIDDLLGGFIQTPTD